MNEPVTSLEFSMPQGIAGTVNVNISDGSASLSDAQTTITLTPDGPVQDGDYISSSIFPPQTTYTSGDYMNVRVFSANCYSDIEPIRLAGRDFKAGHITTVPLRAKSAGRVFRLSFTLMSNNLGQEVKSVTFNFASPVTWGGTQVSSYTYSEPDGSAFEPGEKIALMTFDESEFRSLSGIGFTVSYESEDAIVSVPGHDCVQHRQHESELPLPGIRGFQLHPEQFQQRGHTFKLKPRRQVPILYRERMERGTCRR